MNSPNRPPASQSSDQPSAQIPRIRVTVEVESPTPIALDVQTQSFDGQLFDRKTVIMNGAATAQRPLFRDRFFRLAPWITPRIWVSVALAIYLLVHFIGLDRFPIYFFTDEAVQTVLAQDFLASGFRNYDGELFPTFFENGSQYNLGVSVYAQMLPYWLLGRSVWVTRGTAVLITLAAAWALALMQRRIFNSHRPWLAVLILATTPAWFLHSRTAFETTIAATGYALFIAAYLYYRCVNPRYLYAAVVMAALTFYSYAPARLVMPVAVALLAVVDFGYHRKQGWLIARAVGIGLLLTLPMLRFLIVHPDESVWQMRLLGSYWLKNIPLAQKFAIYFTNYAQGLDPRYWYLPHDRDLMRHTMLGYGHLLRQTLPLGLLGLALVLRRIRQPQYRVLLIALLAAPAGAALVEIGITRVLFVVIPMALITALAVDALLDWAARKLPRAAAGLTAATFLLFTAICGYMLFDTLNNAAFWSRDYTLNGLQYGAQQVFGEVQRDLRIDPSLKFIVSPSWANGTDVVARFFLGDSTSVELGSAEGIYHAVADLSQSPIFVMPENEYAAIPREKFAAVDVLKTLPYPDGRPGFYFVTFQYADDIEQQIAAEEIEKHKLVESDVIINGRTAHVRITRSDIGKAINLFDGDPDTVFRTYEINPLQLEIDFDDPILLYQVQLQLGASAVHVTVEVMPQDKDQPMILAGNFSPANEFHTESFALDQPVLTRHIAIQVKHTEENERGLVHLWEVILK